jgi:hypothetical protein
MAHHHNRDNVGCSASVRTYHAQSSQRSRRIYGSGSSLGGTLLTDHLGHGLHRGRPGLPLVISGTSVIISDFI